jgi:glycogen operon protein
MRTWTTATEPATVWPGRPAPLGATFDGQGTSFSVYSSVAESVALCLFDERGMETRVELPERTGDCWHGYLPWVGPGQRYGFRVGGEYAPERGLRCNAAKLLLDPYARAVAGAVRWGPSVFGYRQGDPAEDLARGDDDSAEAMPRSVVVDPSFDWGDDRRPDTPLDETIVYELHVKGFTRQRTDIPEERRGTYAGLGSEPVVDYLRHLGVTAVELLPVHQFVQDDFLRGRGLRNYWGYDTIGYFAPHNEYSSTGDAGEQVREFKQMVRNLHAAGLEVILDVVYNHTAEGGRMGPTLAFRGLDNAAYYHLGPDDPRSYADFTGCGNSLNVGSPYVLQLVMDSLRYWVEDMHVDGFRFDLATVLARASGQVERVSAFFDMVQQDPVVSRVKLIAEPWDVGPGGYQVGNFPPQWSEWNGRYRDTVRDLWRSQDGRLAEFANRFTGSPDLYERGGRRPFASVNFVTAHDGLTLRDLVSYDGKHNEANGEDDRDGTDDNRSWNCGAEGPTDDPDVNALRARQVRNLLATLLLSQGVPMLVAGDERGRTQQGDNNAYCQDNAISWLDWDHADGDLLAFVRDLVALRRDHPTFRRRGFFQGRDTRDPSVEDVRWSRPDGAEMTDADWATGYAKSAAAFLDGRLIAGTDVRGRPVTDDDFLVAFNAYWEPVTFTVPEGRSWTRTLDTADDRDRGALVAGSRIDVQPRSMVVLRSSRQAPAG